MEVLAHLQLVGRRAPAQHAAGQVDRGQGQLREERRGDVNFPPVFLHFDDAADDQVADLGRVAGAQGQDGEELVGAQDGAGEGRGYGGVEGGVVGAVAAVEESF